MPCVFKSPFAVRLAAGLALTSAGALALLSFRRDSSARFIRRVATESSPSPVASTNQIAGAPAEITLISERNAGETLAAASDDELVALARSRVAASLADALAWAQLQVDPATREKLLFAIVRVWAETDPIAALRWALAREPGGTARFMEAAVTGAARRPELAMEIGRMLLAADPEIGAAHGTMLVGALTGAGEFEAAFQFADAAPAELREEWLASAFRRWAAQKPGAAVKALDSIEDESLRQPLFRSLAEGWAERDPAALTAYTLAQAPSPNRDQVLAVAMLKWGEQDPAAMALWLNTLPRGLDFDVGTAVLVMRTDQANRSVDVALHWVESISTTELRHDSLVHVLAEWEQTDPVSARAYLERVSWLTSDERAVIRVELKHSGRDPPETQDRSPQL